MDRQGQSMNAAATHDLRIALLGFGYAGRTFHQPLIRQVPGLKLTHVVSSKADLSGLSGVRVTAAADEVFADREVDIVVIATPNDTHFDLARRALVAGKHVVVEKPFTTMVSEARELGCWRKSPATALRVSQPAVGFRFSHRHAAPRAASSHVDVDALRFRRFIAVRPAWRLVIGEERERQVVKGACDACETWVARVVRVSPCYIAMTSATRRGAARRDPPVCGACRGRNNRRRVLRSIPFLRSWP